MTGDSLTTAGWRGRSSFPVDAETVRDNALAISGLLVERIGGPSVKPYQPAGYWSHSSISRSPRVRRSDKGEGLNIGAACTRYWARTFPHPSLLAFDAPTREEWYVSNGSRSNTPQQALVLLNDPTYVEAARAFAEILASAKDRGLRRASRLRWAFARPCRGRAELAPKLALKSP